MASKIVLIFLLFAATGYCFRLKLKEKKCSAPMDLVFVLQSTGESDLPYANQFLKWVNAKLWREVKKFAEDFVEKLEGISEQGTHVGIVTFGSYPKINLRLNHYTATHLNAERIQRKIHKLKFLGGSTSISRALDVTNTEMFTKAAGMRENAVRVCRIVVTDGIESSGPPNFADAGSAAGQLKEKGVKIFSAGIGSDIDVMNLILMASTPDYVYSGRNVDSMVKLVEKIQQEHC